MFDAVDMGLIAFDAKFSIVDWNRWMQNRTGSARDTVIGKSLLSLYPNLDTPWFSRNCKAVLRFGNYSFFSQKLHGYCIPIPGIKAEYEHMQQNCTLGPLRNQAGELDGLFLMIQEVTELAIYEKKLASMAQRDGLTGIFNRRHLENHLDTEFERFSRYGRSLSLILMDLDHFKIVNDKYGHPAGDGVLKSFAALLEQRVRAIDILGRYGGEEFCILLPETDIREASELADELVRTTDATVFKYKEEVIPVTASAGISICTAAMQTPKDLIESADQALYEAKNTGRNRAVVNTSGESSTL